MEERFLFLLLLLRQPRLRIVYVTARPIDEGIVEYYLSLLPGVIPQSCPGAAAPGLDGRRLAADAQREAARAAARAGRDPRPDPRPQPLPSRAVHDHDGRARSRARARHPALRRRSAAPAARHQDRLPAAVRRGRRPPSARPRERAATSTAWWTRSPSCARSDPSMREAIVKLNEGVSGRGNALVDLRGLPAPGVARRARGAARSEPRRWRSRRRDAARRVPRPSSPRAAASSRSASPATELRSPSVQLRVTPHGEVELLSTHDQLLGGPSGQSYLGCRFPADFAYAARSRRAPRASASGSRARACSAASPSTSSSSRDTAGAWTPYAIELNLRKGGTTHPFLTLQFLTDGTLRPGDGALHRAERPREAPRRERPPRVGPAARALDRRPVRHRGATPPAFRPGAPDRGDVPHAERHHRTRPHRPDRRRRQPRAGGEPSSGTPSA